MTMGPISQALFIAIDKALRRDRNVVSMTVHPEMEFRLRMEADASATHLSVGTAEPHTLKFCNRPIDIDLRMPPDAIELTLDDDSTDRLRLQLA